MNPYVDDASSAKRRRLTAPASPWAHIQPGFVESGERLRVPIDEPVTTKLNCIALPAPLT